MSKVTNIPSEIREFFKENRRESAIYTMTKILESLNLDSKCLGGLKRDNCQLTNLQLFQLLVLMPIFAVSGISHYAVSGLGRMFGGKKDTLYTFMRQDDVNWRNIIYRVVVILISRIVGRKDYKKSHLPRVLIADDSDLHKTGFKMELIGKIFSHVQQKCILGYKALVMCWSDGRTQFAVDMSLHGEMGKVEGKEQGLTAKQRNKRFTKERDENTHIVKRKEEYFMGKGMKLIEMVKRAIKSKIPFDYLLVDSWFTNTALVGFVCHCHKKFHLLGMAKMGKTKYSIKKWGDMTAKAIISKLESQKEIKYARRYRCHYASVEAVIGNRPIKLFFCRRSKCEGWKVLFLVICILVLTKVQAKAETVVDALSYEIEGEYIGNYYIDSSDFTFKEFDGFRVTLYPVLEGCTYRINHSNTLKGSTICAYYCVYATAELSDMNKETMIQAGASMNPEFPSSAYTDITIGDGGVCLALAEYGGQMVQTLDKIEFIEVCNDPTELAAYHYDGKNLYISYNDKGSEIVYWFTPCMFNKLFTFYRVGHRSVERDWPEVGGIRALDGITVINATESDNIGPMNVFPGEWCGGNHSFYNKDENKNYRTARTVSFQIEADGQIISPSDYGRAHYFLIEVNNEIYDPSLPWENDGNSLNALLSEESVYYKITGNTIEVEVNQRFSKESNCELKCYYGMQSMMLDETDIITPLGAYDDWTDIEEVQPFIKCEYPLFNRFIERKGNLMQASWLINSDNRYVSDWCSVFNRGSGKSYHKIVDGSSFGKVKGKSICWRGAYTFIPEAEVDDDYMLSYCGVYQGKPAWFLNFKQKFSGVITVPNCIDDCKMTVFERHNVNVCPDFIVSPEHSIEVDADRGGTLIYVSKDYDCIEDIMNNIPYESEYYVEIFSGRVYDCMDNLTRGIYIHVSNQNGTPSIEKTIVIQ